MTVLTWQSTAGSLGNYPAGSSISYRFSATSNNPSSSVRYKLLSGSLPAGTRFNALSISLDGLLTGVIAPVTTLETYTFTVRAYDQFNTIRDRTFSITVNVAQAPKFTDPPGKLISIYDSTWLDLQVKYENSVASNTVTITHSSGELPPNLYVTTDGKIRGYAAPPALANGSPIAKTYIFTLYLQSALGNDSVKYSIEVTNQLLSNPPHNRIPAICNSRPLAPATESNLLSAYYLDSTNTIPSAAANDYFTFKIIGKDFDGDALRYNFSKLPPGLSGNPDTGWITGVPTMSSFGVNEYSITVSVSKISRPLIASQPETFSLRILNGLVDDIVWITPEDLGVVYNNTICEMGIVATSSKQLVYSLLSGNLPANLNVENSGALSGRVAFQPANTIMRQDEEVDFIFTVQVYAQEYPSLRSFKTFKLTVKQLYAEPIENVYFKMSPSLEGRTKLNSLLESHTIIPDAFLYRPDDLYFGKSSAINIVHAYGITSSSLTSYLNAINTNYYRRDVVLGEVKTAIARDDNGDILYEVVYSEVVDDLVNPDGVSIPKEIRWPEPINLNLGPWLSNDTDLFASFSDYHVSLSPGYVDEVYPGSLDNMRDVLVENIGQNTDVKLLPRWMSSQQLNGNTLGYVRAWVICYTLPGKSSIIKNNIDTKWGYQLNEIDCSIDRFIVDKSSTYNWNTNLAIPAWNEVPSEVPNFVDPERHDLVVLFKQKTILPK